MRAAPARRRAFDARQRSRCVARAWLGLALLATSCEGFVAELGPPHVGAGCSLPDSDPMTPTPFGAAVAAELLQVHCVYCHEPDAEGNVGFQQSGLDLRTYASLRAGGAHGDPIVVGDPCASLLWRKVTGAGIAGSRMPLGADALAPAQIRRIADWIAEGARDD